MEFRGGDLLGVIFEGEVELVALIVGDMFEETGGNIMKENITTENITMVAIKIRCLRLL
jgi:hypothetical protein